MKGITPGDWEYRPSNSRQVVSETGDTICKVHRGKKAQFNGPLIAAAPKLYKALERMVMEPADAEAILAGVKALAEAEGEQG
jgi:hypothetical protein